MEEKMSATNSFRGILSHVVRAIALSLLFALTMSGTALSQSIAVTGTVTGTGGNPLPGVTIRVQGTDMRATTGPNGRYAITAPSDAVLIFSRVGQKPVQTTVAGRSTVDVTMAQISYLEEVVVTGYQEQRRGDITGAVANVNVEAAQRQTGASVLNRLDAVTPGVTVVSSGSPGARATVRVRGISSFQNNDPLYVIDGTAVSDSYMNFLNPDDIVSIQVLKDASAASIYGTRASNGVVVIETTKKGPAGPPRATLRVRTGWASPVRGYDDFLIQNPLDYAAVVKASYLNAGQPVPTKIFGDPNNPTIPAYIYASPAATLATDQWGRPTSVDMTKYSYPNNLIMAGSTGTDWWKEVFGQTAFVGNYNLDVKGGSADNSYSVSFNYFDQGGTAKYNEFKRGTIRANTAFQRNRFNFGENVALALDRHHGGVTDDPGGYAEDGILGKNILMQTVIPVFDVNGNYAGGKTTGLGNGLNPLKEAFAWRFNENKNNQVFGNVFGGMDLMANTTLRSSLGFNVAQNSFSGFTPIFPENAEATFVNSINENTNQFTEWGWSNTLRYLKAMGQHRFDLLLGQEAGANNNRYIQASMSSLLNDSPDSRYIQDALGDASTEKVLSTGSKSAILSLFTKADWNYADKYVASVTVRRDGSSRLAPGHRWGTFPAFGLGWRITNEGFLSHNRIFSDVMLRYGWGITGNQSVPAGRVISAFGGDRGETYYDIKGQNTGAIPSGFRQTTLGNPDLKWEENKSSNIGADMSLFDGALNVVVDVYRRASSNLLFDPKTPATAGIAAPPIVNIGKMRNTGVDFSIGHQGRDWNVSFNGSHYHNEIVSINGVQDFFYGPITTRYGNQVINEVGHPIGSFYGYIADGFFKDDADVKSHATQDGAAPGRIKFRDVNGDGKIDLSDRTIIGSPHPNFTAGVDFGMRRGNFDLSATLFGSYGNKIFENQMEFYVFREFDANVKSDLLANSWRPDNLNAKYPKLDVNDLYSHALSSFYVKDGSYTRLRNLQIGYDVPASMSRTIPLSRIYVQAENLFTITSYDGLDPSLPAANITGAAGDIRDQYRGVDRGAYPSNKMFSVGIVASF